jgi:hypothetical protein
MLSSPYPVPQHHEQVFKEELELLLYCHAVALQHGITIVYHS